MKKKSKTKKRIVRSPQKIGRKRPNPLNESDFVRILDLLISNHALLEIYFKYGAIFGRLSKNGNKFEIQENYLNETYPQINFSFNIDDVLNIIDKPMISPKLFMNRNWTITLKS